jgi:hypothetical protein
LSINAHSVGGDVQDGVFWVTSLPNADELNAAVSLALESIAELGGPTAQRHFHDTVAASERHGQAVAAQHLRNLLLAYVNPQSFRRQPLVGFRPRMRPNLAELVEGIDQALFRHFEAQLSVQRPRAHGGAARILMLVDHLPIRDRMFSHTRQICTYAATLALDPSVEAICILATQETAPENPFHAVAEALSVQDAGWREELEEVGEGPVPKVQFFTPARVGPVRNYQRAIDRILDFDPDMVFSHEGIFRSRLLPSLLRPQVAIVAVQMNQNNPEPPYADLVLAHGDGTDFSHKPTPSKWRAHPVPLIPFPKQLSINARELGPPSPLRVVTVLTLGRLEKGLMKDDAAALKFVISFLEDHVEAVWLMVAVEDPESFAEVIAPYLSPGVVDRLRLLPAVPDLRGIFEHCHIYMHLPPLGGGNMGVAMAIDEGVPVLARKGTDAANSLHPTETYADETQAARVLSRLAGDAALRSRWVSRQRQRIRQRHSKQALNTAFQTLLPDARANFETRRAADAMNEPEIHSLREPRRPS